MKPYATILIVLMLISASFIGVSYKVEKYSTVSSDSNIIYIDDNNTDGPWDGTIEHPFQYIQDGIDHAIKGGTVFVFNGTYGRKEIPQNYDNIVLINKSINLVGEDKNKTIIDGNTNWGNLVEITADWVNISGFTINHTDYGWKGISINSNKTTIRNNIVKNTQVCISFYLSNNNTVTGNLLSNNGLGIGIEKSINNIISDNNISNNYLGIDLLYSSNYNIIKDNNIINNGYWGEVGGIRVWYSGKNTISSNNIISNNGAGIDFHYSSSNTILDNTISDNDYGINIYDTSSNTIIGNYFLNNGLYLEDSYNNNVENNTVNEKPLYYLEDESDKVIDYDVGQVIIVNCSNITVENLNLSNTDVGLELWGTDNSVIRNNSCFNNTIGVYLGSSENNTITENNIDSNNDKGIKLYNSTIITIKGNNINTNNGDGLYLKDSFNNTVINNYINSNNRSGFATDYSNDNIIEGNTILENGYGKYGGEGIRLSSSNRNIITDNTIKSNIGKGLYIANSNSNSIKGNTIYNNSDGLYFWFSQKNSIIRNVIISQNSDIYFENSIKNTIKKNNFFENKQDEFFRDNREFLWEKNIWRFNYWNRPRLLPKLIVGIVKPPFQEEYTWINFDWRPALRPYDI